MPPPALRMRLAMARTFTKLLHSSQASISISVSGPSTRFCAQSLSAHKRWRDFGRNVRAPPLNDVTVGVVMRRLDQRDPESARPHGQTHPSNQSSEPDLPSTADCAGKAAFLQLRSSGSPVIFRSGLSSYPNGWVRNYRERQYFNAGGPSHGPEQLGSLRAEKRIDPRWQKRRHD